MAATTAYEGLDFTGNHPISPGSPQFKFILRPLTETIFSENAIVNFHAQLEWMIDRSDGYDPADQDLLERIMVAWFEGVYSYTETYPEELFEIDGRPVPEYYDPFVEELDLEIADFESKLIDVFKVLTLAEKSFVANVAIEYYLQEGFQREPVTFDSIPANEEYQKALLTIFSALKQSEFNLDEEEEFINKSKSDIPPIKKQLENLRHHHWYGNYLHEEMFDDPIADQILNLFKISMIKYAYKGTGKFSRAQIIEALRMSGGDIKRATARLIQT